MVAVTKTWTSTLNVDLGSTDQGAQYKTLMFEWKKQLLLAGWSVTRSSNGTTADTNDNWNSTSDITWNTSTTARSWIVLAAPTGWGSPSSGNRFHLLIDCTEANGSSDTTPQTIHTRLGTRDYSNTSPSTSVRPTIATGGVENNESSTLAALNWTSPTAARVHFWYASDGDVLWSVKRNTDTAMLTTYWLVDAVNGLGNFRAIRVWETGTSPHTRSSSFYWFSQDGTFGSSTSSTGALNSPATSTTQWPGGNEASGAGKGFFPVYALINNSAGQYARYLGHLADIWYMSGTTADSFNFEDPADTDPKVLRGLNGYALPVASADPAFD